jgi:hypothetical protein
MDRRHEHEQKSKKVEFELMWDLESWSRKVISAGSQTIEKGGYSYLFRVLSLSFSTLIKKNSKIIH